MRHALDPKKAKTKEATGGAEAAIFFDPWNSAKNIRVILS